MTRKEEQNAITQKPRNAIIRDLAALVAVVQFVIVIVGGIYSYLSLGDRLASIERRLERIEAQRESESVSVRLHYLEQEINRLRDRK